MLSATLIFVVCGYVLSERKNRLSITLARYARMIGKPLFKALFCTFSLRMRKQYDSLDVRCHRKHVDRLNLLNGVMIITQYSAVSRKRRWITGDIDNPFG